MTATLQPTPPPADEAAVVDDPAPEPALSHGPPATARLATRLLLAAAAAAWAGWLFEGTFTGGDLVPPILVPAVVATAASVVATSVLRLRLAASVAVGVAAALMGGLPAGIGPADVLAGLRDGPQRILTSAAPAPDLPDLLAWPYLLVFAAAWVGAELVQRARAAAWPLLASLLSAGVALAFGPEGQEPSFSDAAVWSALAVGQLALGRARPESAPAPADRRAAARARRQLVLAVPVGALAVLLALPLARHLPGSGARDRFELRDLVAEDPAPSPAANPLGAVTALQAREADDVQLTVAASARFDRLRLTVLDEYDGVSWSSSAEYLPAGAELPADPAVDRPTGEQIVQDIELHDLAGVHLPAVDRPVRIDRSGLHFDPVTGVIIAAGSRPDRYRVTSVVAEPDLSTLPSAPAASDPEALAALDLPPGVPEELVALAEDVAGAGSAYSRAVALTSYLSAPSDDGFTLVVDEPPSGHTVGHITCFLLLEDRCGRSGSTEQFVASFAVLARAAGLPTRVVVGFRAPNVAPGETGEVPGALATAWAEVKLEGAGWVPFDPTPDPSAELAPPPEDVAGDETDDVEPPPPVEPGEGATDIGDDGAGAQDETVAERLRDPRLLAAAALALVALVLTLPGLLRWRRRERRRRRDPMGQVTGAWDEALDDMAVAGVLPAPGEAVRDVVERTRAHVGEVAEPLVPLGSLVNAALFGPEPPTPEDATAAWALVDAFQARRRRDLSPAHRVREYFSPRGLLTRR